MVQVLTSSEAKRFIVDLLRANGRMTTREIETLARREGKRCPDETVLFLSKMKALHEIQGEISQEKRGWVWWI